MKRLFLMLATLTCLHSNSQDTTQRCWTQDPDTTIFFDLPWYGNNDFLENFLDSIQYDDTTSLFRIIGKPQVKFWIPIKFWIYRNEDGTGGPNQTQLQSLMDNLNRRYNQLNRTMIGFYMKCQPTYINNSSLTIQSFTGGSLRMAANRDEGCINVHLIDEFNNPDVTGFSLEPLNACMLPASSYLAARNNGDLSHEIGHVLGLVHTHLFSASQSKCMKECVSRSRTWPTFNFCFGRRLISNRVCEATGDGLGDTQADENLVANNSCSYNVSFGNDLWGDSYDNPPNINDRPNVRNIMSYNTATDCINQFSRLQIAVMLYTLLFKKYADVGHYANQVQTFDSYEPDNLAEVARPINFGEIQLHDFHTQYNKINGNAFFNQCDVDWVRFQPTCSGNFVVRTFAIVGRNEANTRLTLFNSSMTQLVQNDDISSGNLFSALNYNFVSGQTYFVRIENMSPNETSYYSLQIGGYTMEGPDIVCSTSSFGITNLPQNALVSWAPLPAGIVTINPDIGPSTNVTKQNDGDFILRATITSGCSSNPIEIERNLKAGLHPSFILGPYDPLAHTIMGVTCVNEQYYFVASEVLYDPQQSYMWILFPPPGTSSFPTLHSGSTVYLTFIETGLHTLRVTKTNSCGTISTDMLIDVQLCSGSLRIIASPNPTKNKLTVQLMDSYGNHEQLSLEEVVTMELYQAATGIKQRSWSFKNNQKSFELNVAGLNRGIYILRVSKGKFWHTKQIIIE